MSKMLGSLTRKVASALGGLALLVASERADANVISVDSGMDVCKINSAISGSKSGDTINFKSGTYAQSPLEDAYNLAPNRDYTFDKVTINGSGIEDGRIFRIADGGNMNITGNLTLQNVLDGFYIGQTSYDNINISGVTFNVLNYGVVLKNKYEIINPPEKTKASVFVYGCVADGGKKMIKYDPSDSKTNQFSPYAGAQNNTIMNLSEFMMDAPKASIPNKSIHILGNNEISENVLINCAALSDPGDYSRYESPINIAQDLNVTNPLVTGGGIYHDTEGNPHPYNFDGENCFVTSDMKFIPGTYIPQHGSPLNLGEGKYIGAYVPEGSARISNARFSITPQNDLHTKLRTVDLQVDFTGNKISLLNAGNSEHPQKTDIKYKVEYVVDDHNPDTPDTVLSSAKYHFTFLNSDEIAELTNPELPAGTREDPINFPITVGGNWDIEAIIKDYTSGKLLASNVDYFQINTINPPDWYSQEFSIPLDSWEPVEGETYSTCDIYARITNEASGLPGTDNFNNYVQVAPFETGRVTVTGLPEPATFGLLAAGVLPTLVGYLRRKRKNEEELADRCSEWGPRRKHN